MRAQLAALLMTIAACGAAPTAGASTTGTSPTGTLTGRVTAGPTCPAERVGHPCPPAPVSATVRAKTARGQVVASTHTDATGRFHLRLRPGKYVVVAVTPKPYPRCSPITVTVAVNLTTRTTISCDTGIR